MFINRKHTPETKMKMRLARLGKKRAPFSEEWKNKLRLASLGNKSRTGQAQSPEERRKKSIAERGEKHWNWQGGLTRESILLRNSVEYKLWREAIFKRDNWTCQSCHLPKSGKLEAHHIKPFSLFPELRFAIDNGVTMCKECHKQTDTYFFKMNHLKRMPYKTS